MAELVIRHATLADLDMLAANNRAMARETESKELDEVTVRSGTRAVLEDASKGFYLVAGRGGAVVGQLMVTFEWSDWRDATFWWIQSVYVTPAARRGGVFRALFDRVLIMAKEHGDVCGIRLYAESGNRTAHSTYASLGMRRSKYKVYELALAPDGHAA